ncbi:hypothetical protein R5R35_003297 [Gryllus longicercus]|uniref:adenosine deaminase n=1 Tax=Gryllus longicercus TaxID=2509291 RepID=A0AAN9VQP6_9ORTH
MFPGRRTLAPAPRTRIELHAHLDGCVRHETIWELMRSKKMKMPGDGTFHALQEALVVRDPVDLAHFLEPFNIFSRAIAGDLSAVERVAYEFCEDKAHQGVLYVEARYTPHMWLKTKDCRGMINELSDVVRAVNRGFARAEASEGIKARSILCVLNGMGIAADILSLCDRFRDDGVVGIDMAAPSNMRTKDYEEVPLTPEELQAFQTAARLGIHRTVHAGEAGGPVMVQRAVDDYLAERIGHGYHVVKDNSVYKMCQERDIHFECCPWSSLLTGSVNPGISKHPIARFAEDEVNFSLNTDDTTITGMTLQNDYDLAGSWGLTEAHVIRANINALRCSFLPQKDKDALMSRLLDSLGVIPERKAK